MEPREPPRLSLVPSGPEVLLGVVDEAMPVAIFFDGFDWESTGPDAELLSAEDFLSSLGP